MSIEPTKFTKSIVFSGDIVRVGGTVDHLPEYSGFTVTDLNIENRRKKKYGNSLIGKIRYGYDMFEQEMRYWRKGYRAVRDRKTIFMDSHDIIKLWNCDKKFNGCISSNVLEHSPNLISMLVNLNHILENDAYHFHAIPLYSTIFDWYRKPTTLAHFIEDFENKTAITDMSHNKERQKAATEKKVTLNNKEERYPHAHYHVFDEDNTKKLFEYVF